MSRVDASGHRRVGRLLKLHWMGRYYQIFLTKNSITKGFQVSRLVLLGFSGKPKKNMQASHLNGKTKNNRTTNLAWETSKQNAAHHHEHGTVTRHFGETNGSSKLTYKKAQKIRSLYKNGKGNSYTLASKFGVAQSTIMKIIHNKRWGARSSPQFAS